MTPQNEGYFHAAYLIAALLYGGYAVSLWWRARAVASRPRSGERPPS